MVKEKVHGINKGFPLFSGDVKVKCKGWSRSDEHSVQYQAAEPLRKLGPGWPCRLCRSGPGPAAEVWFHAALKKNTDHKECTRDKPCDCTAACLTVRCQSLTAVLNSGRWWTWTASLWGVLHKEAVYVLFRSKQRTEKKLGVTDEK